ncbi:MAG: hypothetical protein QOI84_504 [Solirubrobacterales bacterium]|jgi:hypothetical protein|nr:hypothetical protein [Solirubrobacterales bacterium]
MSVHELRKEVQQGLSAFVWEQWGQMGMLSASAERDRWAADPEALLLLSFEVGREEPRLFEEVLDWMLVNERLLSTQRLRNLARDEADRALAGAAIAWLREWRRRGRAPEPEWPPAGGSAEPLFLDVGAPVERLDPAFLEHELLKGWREPERRSAQPDLEAPINLALRLRSLLGVGTRAEVVRVLLTADAPRMSVQALAASTGYAKRNVQEAAASLRAAGAAGSSTIGNEQRFELPRRRWLELLNLPSAPLHVDWPQLFRALRVLLRWLREHEDEERSEYMLASEARRVLESVAEDLRFAGVPVNQGGPDGAEYWPHFVSVVRSLVPPRG